MATALANGLATGHKKRWGKDDWNYFGLSTTLMEWLVAELGRTGEGQVEEDQFYLASVKSKSRMKNECGLWIFQLPWHRSLSLQQRYNYPPYGNQRSMVICGRGWSATLSRCGDCPGTSLYPKPLAASVCPFSKEKSFQLCWPLFILPGGSCLDIVFHSLLIEFCFFYII